MSIISRMRKQSAVYWPPGSEGSGGKDFDIYGQPLYALPVEIKCRWEDVVVEFVDAKGTRQISRSKVFVDRDVSVGGLLMLGTIDDITDLENPRENEGAWEIRRFDKIPNLKNTETLLIVWL